MCVTLSCTLPTAATCRLASGLTKVWVSAIFGLICRLFEVHEYISTCHTDGINTINHMYNMFTVYILTNE